MLPSSLNKICCNEQSCPKSIPKNEEAIRGTYSSEKRTQYTGGDKGTKTSLVVATSPSVQTLIPTKTPEKSTEANFDRNYTNISSYLYKFCYSNSSKTSPTESQMSAIMLKCYSSTSTTAKSQPSNQPKPPTRRRPKCICRNINITPSSSCSSLSSEYSEQIKFLSKRSQTQHKAQRLQKTPTKRVNISYDELAKPQSLQAEIPNQPTTSCEAVQTSEKFYTSFDQQPKTDYSLGNNSKNLHFVASSEEQFYSCSSDDSETDEKSAIFFESQNRSITHKKYTILQLLHEVENLINKDNLEEKNLPTEATPSNPTESSIKDTTQETKLRFNDKVSKWTSTTQLDTLIWPAQPCFCNCRAHMPPDNFSFFPPFNLTTPASDGAQLPEPFVYEENNSLKEAPSGNKSILTADQLASNLSVNAHTPMEYTVESPCSSLAAVNNIKVDVSIQISESLCLKEDVGTECDALNDQSWCDNTDSFKDCSSGENSLLAADKFPVHLTCTCISKQILLEGRNESFLLSCIPVKGAFNLAETANVCVRNAALDRPVDREFFPNLLQTEEYVDEELHPCYVDKMFTEPFEVYKSNTDALPEYDDEEPVLEKFSAEGDIARAEDLPPIEKPTYKYNFKTEEEVNQEPEIVDSEKLPLPAELDPCSELEMLPELGIVQNVASIPHREFQNLHNPIENAETEQLNGPAKLNQIEDEKIPQNVAKAESDSLSYSEHDNKDIDEAEKSVDKSEDSSASPPSKKEEISDKRGSKQVMSYESNGEEEELAKEKLAEERKRHKPDGNDEVSDKEMVTRKQADPKRRYAEMKYFIDSLILDLEAMDYARRLSHFEKICKAHCIRDSFPVTITDVTKLGANSLYVKWKIHDCFGIGGYEIYTDGYLTNRFYNSRHDAAVVTHVDVSLPHRIALVAQPEASDSNFDFISNMSKKCNKLKTLPRCTANGSLRQSRGTLWTPSIFLYDPPPTPAFERNDSGKMNLTKF